MKLYPAIILSVFLLTACEIQSDLPGPIDQVHADWINFSDPQDGQKTMYLRYESTCENLDKDFTYTGDTLIVEVQKTERATVLMEYYTTGSPSFEFQADTAFHEIFSHGSFVLLPERENSSLFWFYGNDTLRLNPDTHEKIKQDRCHLSVGGRNFLETEIGYLKNFDMGPIHIEDKSVVSCIPMIIASNAYLFHDANHLYMSHTSNESEFMGTISSHVSGWVAMEMTNS